MQPSPLLRRLSSGETGVGQGFAVVAVGPERAHAAGGAFDAEYPVPDARHAVAVACEPQAQSAGDEHSVARARPELAVDGLEAVVLLVDGGQPGADAVVATEA